MRAVHGTFQEPWVYVCAYRKYFPVPNFQMAKALRRLDGFQEYRAPYKRVESHIFDVEVHVVQKFHESPCTNLLQTLTTDKPDRRHNNSLQSRGERPFDPVVKIDN